MITHEEWLLRMDGIFGGSLSANPCQTCEEDACICDRYLWIQLGDAPQYKELPREEQMQMRENAEIARMRIPDTRIGWPCERMNLWLFGLDYEGVIP